MNAVFEVIEAVHREGVAVLSVGQNVQKALVVANRAYVLAEGCIISRGPLAELLGQPDIYARFDPELCDSGGSTEDTRGADSSG